MIAAKSRMALLRFGRQVASRHITAATTPAIATTSGNGLLLGLACHLRTKSTVAVVDNLGEEEEAHPKRTNAELWKRRVDAVPRGVGSTTQLFVEHAENALMFDVEGKRYIDFAGGIGVLNTGHRHPKVVAAVEDQLHKIIHSCFQVMAYEPYIDLAERLNAIVEPIIHGPAKSILFSTGAEAVENAVKIARSYTKRSGIISFSGGFHGRTMMGMALTGKIVPYKSGFGPFPSDVHHIRFPHEYRGVEVDHAIADLEHVLKSSMCPSRVAAIIIEPVQGEGGFTVAPPEFMRYLREVCDREGILLISDEVQSGFARTGKWFAIEHYSSNDDGGVGCRPDIITTAKSIGGGLPISAVIGRAEVMDAPAPGGLGGTYAGNPLACAASCAVIDVIREEGILERAHVIGHSFKDQLEEISCDVDNGVGDVRGLGAMVAFEFVKPGTTHPDPDRAKRAVDLAAERGLILLSCGLHGNTIRVLVPITVEDDVFQEGMDILKGVIADTRLG